MPFIGLLFVHRIHHVHNFIIHLPTITHIFSSFYHVPLMYHERDWYKRVFCHCQMYLKGKTGKTIDPLGDTFLYRLILLYNCGVFIKYLYTDKNSRYTVRLYAVFSHGKSRKQKPCAIHNTLITTDNKPRPNRKVGYVPLENEISIKSNDHG